MYNNPDAWCILRFELDPGTIYYRLFATWSGGYTTGDSWRMNSGIVGMIEESEHYVFEGASGSAYKCHKEGYGIRGMIGHGVIASWKNKYGEDAVQIIPEDGWKELVLSSLTLAVPEVTTDGDEKS